MLRLWALGSWRAEFNELPIPRLPTRHARALLARLALAHPRPVDRTQLHHDLFPNTATESAAGSLRTTLYYLRRGLPVQVVSEDDQIALGPSITVDVDVRRFEQASVSGATQSMLETAVELYRGPFLQSSEG
ncbi:MAG: hypothetical protein AVDCRST_MAG93-4154 [uncultured Chloroflexia bacterium]|uniref:Bacterial transcriptional activator domain-containing protein n=1 Tax=uncultured Chloroflexia bacterium TaxID=1672391 RepID=A0A6J4K348_9CHLR|nr:MAG: hypothetical protein AVDCRST_MAG93-4154 [uncultured Chloroflexia bacterium]